MFTWCEAFARVSDRCELTLGGFLVTWLTSNNHLQFFKPTIKFLSSLEHFADHVRHKSPRLLIQLVQPFRLQPLTSVGIENQFFFRTDSQLFDF